MSLKDTKIINQKLNFPTPKKNNKRMSKKITMIAREIDDINNVVVYDLGPMSKVCNHCKAMFFECENKRCCKNGLLCPVLYPKLLKFESISPLFKELYLNRHPLSKSFFENIRLLNSLFSFTSLGIKKTNLKRSPLSVDYTKGTCNILFNGDVYHYIIPLNPNDEKERCYSQILFYENKNEELERRKEIKKEFKSKISDSLIELIQEDLHQNNQFYQKYKEIGREVMNKNDNKLVIVDDHTKLVITSSENDTIRQHIQDLKPKNHHKKLYNKPITEEISILVDDKYENERKREYRRDIIVEQKSNKFEKIDVVHPAIDQLSYTMLYPNGTLGWSPKMTYEKITPIDEPKTLDDYISTNQDKNLKLERITLAMYVLFFMQIRYGMLNLLSRGIS